VAKQPVSKKIAANFYAYLPVISTTHLSNIEPMPLSPSFLKTLFLASSFAFISCFVVAQKANITQLKAKFPNDEMAYLLRSEKVNMDILNGQLVIDVLHKDERMFLDERASNWADERIYYSEAFQEVLDVEAFSMVPEKAGLKKVPVADIKTEKPSPSAGVFFDDMFVKKFTFPSAKQGGTGTLSYRERIKNPYMLSGFAFGNYVPILNAEFSVSFPADVKVSYKTFGDMRGIVFKQTTQNGRTTYAWKAQNLKAYPIENESPSFRHYVPQVFLFVENYVVNGKKTEILGDIPKLFSFYKSLVKDLNQQPDPALSATADSLTRGKNELEKIKSVYYWVQDKVKYIAFEEGLGGFVPRQAADVCRKRYGDCKDMASLITAMLKVAKVPAQLVWIGTRDIPFRYAENPSMAVDNHMIAAVKVAGEWQFLDATDDRIDFGLPTSHIQGKEAMIMTDDGKYEIVQVPIVPASQNTKRDSIVLQYDNRTLRGTGQCSFDGLYKTYMKSVLQYRSEPQQNEYFKDFFSRGSNKSTLEKISKTPLEERDAPLRFNYVFRVPDYVQQVGNEVFINPHLTRMWTDRRIEDTRRNDWKYNYQQTEEYITVLPIPAGQVVTNLPANVAFSHSKFGFEVSYEQTESQIIVRNKLLLNTLLVKKEDFAEWNKMIAALNDAYTEVISLKKR
jgi:Domain of Unknown Function with PDB structure (DUF3857)/Transglutaminase-like superfamily